jgi:hypothetical protein
VKEQQIWLTLLMRQPLLRTPVRGGVEFGNGCAGALCAVYGMGLVAGASCRRQRLSHRSASHVVCVDRYSRDSGDMLMNASKRTRCRSTSNSCCGVLCERTQLLRAVSLAAAATMYALPTLRRSAPLRRTLRPDGAGLR